MVANVSEGIPMHQNPIKGEGVVLSKKTKIRASTVRWRALREKNLQNYEPLHMPVCQHVMICFVAWLGGPNDISASSGEKTPNNSHHMHR